MRFRYTASKPDGKIVEGEIEVSRKEDVLAFLSSHGLQPVSIKQARSIKSFFGKSLFRTKIGTSEKIFFCKHLSLMLRTGIDLFRSLDILLSDIQKKSLTDFLREAKNTLSSGQPFYSVFARFPQSFDQVFVNLVKAGEAAGNLDKIFEDLSTALEKQQDLKNKIRAAMIYPAILLGTSVIILSLLLTVALPKVADVFTSSGFEPPLFSKVVFAIGRFMSSYLLIIFGILTAVILGLVYLYKFSPLFRRFLFLMIGKLPVFSNVISKISLQRFADTLSSLLKSGLTINESIEITAQAVGNEEFKVSLFRISKEGLAKGLTISEAFRREAIFPRTVVSLISVSEKAGHIEDLLGTLARFYETEIDTTLKSLVSLFEPIMLLVIGVFVAFIALSLIVPIYQLVTQF